MECLPVADQVIKEGINQGRLSKSDIATDADNTSMSVLRLVKCAAQCIAFQLTTYDVMRTAIGHVADDPCRRLIVHCPHWRDESVTRLANCFDVSVIAWLFIQKLPQRRHISVQVAFFDKAVGPHIFDQVFFGHRLTRPLEKEGQNSKDCWRDRLGRTGSHQNKLSRINPKVIKLVYSSCCQHAGCKAFWVPNGLRG